ncbi:ADP-ribosyl cyclase/cyclic ADP-ribose hydrolase-like [Ptychodera flava]|uniref:ADP-ribosyl cyclase/cyclic ADP-ribose hydrolase-like n=1 Tax=Ptychodera flava TaxID=63121 RepID=UPI00396A4376
MNCKGSTYFVLMTMLVLYLSSGTCLAHMDKHRLQIVPLATAGPEYGFLSPEVISPEKGTTLHLKDIFLGRCWDYQCGFNRATCDTSNLKNCTRLWELFQAAFTYRDPCNVTHDMYEPFSQAAMQPVAVNKILFWSGTYYLAHTYASETRRFTTLEDTLPGYLLKMLVWCGQVDYPGINYDSCSGDCFERAQDAFWGTVSANFAKQARGVATVMLNGSRETGAFRNDSFFAKYEFPNLDRTKVTSINIVIIHSLDVPKVESCGEGSVLALQKLLQGRGFKYECVDDPDAIHYILCSENPESRDCKAWQLSMCDTNVAATKPISGVLVLMAMAFHLLSSMIAL